MERPWGRFSSLVILTVALMLALVACGGPVGPDDGGPPPPDPTTWRHLMIGSPSTLDPVLAYDTVSGRVLENVYETLYGFASSSTELSPRLATAHVVSPDGLTYTFTLREGVEFHSGNSFSCKDVEWSLEYGLVTAQPNGAVNYLIGRHLLGTTANGGDKATYMAEVDFATIDKAIECPDGPDGHTVKVTLMTPEPALLAILSYSSFSIIDSGYAKANGMWDGTEATWEDWVGRNLTNEHLHGATSGTGAYLITEIAANFEKVTLGAFEGYWAGAPDLDTVVIEQVLEEAARVAAIKSGDADLVDSIGPAGLAELRTSPGVAVLSDETWSSTSISAAMFNFEVAATSPYIGSGVFDGAGIPSDFFADVEIRRAFSHLFDAEGYLTAAGRDGAILTMALPPSFEGYDATADVRLLDLDAAEQHLRNALTEQQWTDGFEFTAIYNVGNTGRQSILQGIADNLAAVNPTFVMNVESQPWSDFLSQTYSGQMPIALVGWAADYGDASNFINPFYDANGNYAAATAIDVPAIQQVVDAAKVEFDASARAAIYEQLGDLHYEHAPMVVVPVVTPVLVTREGVTGIYYNPILSSRFLWKDISKD